MRRYGSTLLFDPEIQAPPCTQKTVGNGPEPERGLKASKVVFPPAEPSEYWTSSAWLRGVDGKCLCISSAVAVPPFSKTDRITIADGHGVAFPTMETTMPTVSSVPSRMTVRRRPVVVMRAIPAPLAIAASLPEKSSPESRTCRKNRARHLIWGDHRCGCPGRLSADQEVDHDQRDHEPTGPRAAAHDHRGRRRGPHGAARRVRQRGAGLPGRLSSRADADARRARLRDRERRRLRA